MAPLSYEKKRQIMLRVRKRGEGKGGKRGRKKGVPQEGPKITAENLIEAIAVVGPVKNRMAKYIGVGYCAIAAALKKEKYQHVAKIYHDAMEWMADLAEETLVDCMEQRKDLNTAASTARWFLMKKNIGQERGYSDKKTVALEGGDKPVQVETNASPALIPIESLDLPLEVRRELLKAIEQEKEPKPKKRKIKIRKKAK